MRCIFLLTDSRVSFQWFMFSFTVFPHLLNPFIVFLPAYCTSLSFFFPTERSKAEPLMFLALIKMCTEQIFLFYSNSEASEEQKHLWRTLWVCTLRLALFWSYGVRFYPALPPRPHFFHPFISQRNKEWELTEGLGFMFGRDRRTERALIHLFWCSFMC